MKKLSGSTEVMHFGLVGCIKLTYRVIPVIRCCGHFYYLVYK